MKKNLYQFLRPPGDLISVDNHIQNAGKSKSKSRHKRVTQCWTKKWKRFTECRASGKVSSSNFIKGKISTRANNTVANISKVFSLKTGRTFFTVFFGTHRL